MSKLTESAIDSALSWAKSIASEDSHGYSQKVRWGPSYDCSSFVISAYKQAGIEGIGPVGNWSVTYTGNMSNLTSYGFSNVTNSVNIATGEGLKPGDILVVHNNNSQHAVMYAGNGKIVHASSPSRGILVDDYYNGSWGYVFRLTDDKAITGSIGENPDTVEVDIPEEDLTNYDSPLVSDNNPSLSVLLDGYEILPNLDSQPYYAFVDLTFGGHTFPSVPSDYLQNLTVQDLGTEGATISMVLLDRYGDEIEELLYKSKSEENYVRFGHVTGRQSKTLKFEPTNYTINFEPQGTVLTVSGISTGAYNNLSTDNVFSAGRNPSVAVKKICDKLGYQYDDTTIKPSDDIILSDGTVKEFNLINDNLIDYIHQKISPYAVNSSDGSCGYQFYVDEDTTPPTAHFHPVEISDNVIRTYVYQKGLNTNVISFDISTDFVISGEGAVGITSVLEANVLDPVTKKESSASSDINSLYINVNGEYSHIKSNQSKTLIDTSGMSYGEAVSNIDYRMRLSQGTFVADLTIVGDPTIKINNVIRIIVLTKRNTLHHTSGLYLIKGVSHSISSGIMITTLNVNKKNDIEGSVELKSYKSLYK